MLLPSLNQNCYTFSATNLYISRPFFALFLQGNKIESFKRLFITSTSLGWDLWQVGIRGWVKWGQEIKAVCFLSKLFHCQPVPGVYPGLVQLVSFETKRHVRQGTLGLGICPWAPFIWHCWYHLKAEVTWNDSDTWPEMCHCSSDKSQTGHHVHAQQLVTFPHRCWAPSQRWQTCTTNGWQFMNWITR